MLDISCEKDKLHITKYILKNHINMIDYKRIKNCLDVYGSEIYDCVDIEILSQYNHII